MPQALQGKGKGSISLPSSRMHLDRALAAQLSLNFIPLRVSGTKRVLIIRGTNIEPPTYRQAICQNCTRMTFSTDISKRASQGTLPNATTLVDYFGDLNYLNISIMPDYYISRVKSLRQLDMVSSAVSLFFRTISFHMCHHSIFFREFYARLRHF